MKNVTVSNLSLVLAFALVLVSIAISAKEKAGIIEWKFGRKRYIIL